MSRIDPCCSSNGTSPPSWRVFQNLRDDYNRLTNPKELHTLRKRSAAVMLQAPTGIGKTLIATEVVAEFSALDNVVWFWFAPYATLIDQAAASLQRQAPQLKVLNIEHQRTVDELASGRCSSSPGRPWQPRPRSRAGRVTTGDAGLSVDDLIAQARALGLRVGVVVDEAHHGFVKGHGGVSLFLGSAAARLRFDDDRDPRDTDVARFAEKDGLPTGRPTDWASITRHEGYQAGLLKLEGEDRAVSDRQQRRCGFGGFLRKSLCPSARPCTAISGGAGRERCGAHPADAGAGALTGARHWRRRATT